MSKGTLAIAAAVALGLIALVIWLVGEPGEERETAVVERGSIDVTIQTVGSVQASGATTVRAEVGGVVEMLGVRSGDVVSEGDIVALLELEPFDRSVENAERELEQAEFALQVLERQSDVPSDNAAPSIELLAAAERVDRAEVALADAIQARRDAAILAPTSGTAIELNVREGDVVSANQPLARFATPVDLFVIADVDELDLPNVQPGAEASFRLDAFPATEVTGMVISIAPQARQQGGATVFATEIAFEAPADLDIRPGMNADITIVTTDRDDILLIPESALRTVGDRSFVQVETDDGIDEREIVLGYRSGGRVEVVSGLEEGERVVLR